MHNFESRFDRFAGIISSLPASFDSELPLPAGLRMEGDGRHEIYYAPFDYVMASARVVLVGITPGRRQAVEALTVARQFLQAGTSHEEAMRAAKASASFAGPMRRNLVEVLDHVGLADRLGIPSTASLWDTDGHLAHFTSALRYPVFEAGENFGGAGMQRSSLLTKHLDTWFEAECRGLTSAIFIPLGPAAEAACDRMISRGALSARQLLRGLPHPSGANAERIAYFLGRKARAELSSKTSPEKLDSAKAKALECVREWAAA